MQTGASCECPRQGKLACPDGESWLTVSAAAGHRALSGGGRLRMYRSVADRSKLPNFWVEKKMSCRGTRGAGGPAPVSMCSLFSGHFFLFAGDSDDDLMRSGRSAGDPRWGSPCKWGRVTTGGEGFPSTAALKPGLVPLSGQIEMGPIQVQISTAGCV